MENFTFVDGHFVSRKFFCQCGKEHHVPIREIIVRRHALDGLGEVLQRLEIGKKCLVIADLNTYAAAGEKVLDVLKASAFSPKLCLFNTREWVLPNESAIGKVLFEIELDTSFLLVVGSGSLTDLTRYISSRTELPFAAVPTAASMDGYTSAVAVILQDGFKRTLEATYPQAIIADLDVLCQSPAIMTTAGFSDLIGKFNARVDWQLSAMTTGEYYCEFVVDLVNATVKRCAENAARIKRQDPDIMGPLAEGLLLSGIGMLITGNSRPASGSEHHLAHYWEMRSFGKHPSCHLHGTKVGVATGIMAKFYEKFFARNPANIDLTSVKRRKPSLAEWERNVRQCFGPVADGVLKQSPKLYLNWDVQQRQIATLQAKWAQLQSLRQFEPTFAQLVALHQAVGGSIFPQEIDVDQALLREALLNAKDVRDRYSVLRAAESLGWLEEITDEVVREYDFTAPA